MAGVAPRPVLVINGTEDSAIPLSMGRQLSDSTTNGRLWVIEGAGHGDFAKKFGPGFYRELDRFLRANLLATEQDTVDTGHVSAIEGRSN